MHEGFSLSDSPVKAGGMAGVAGRTGRVDQDEQGVRVAIIAYFDDLLDIAGGGALVPEFGA